MKQNITIPVLILLLLGVVFLFGAVQDAGDLRLASLIVKGSTTLEDVQVNGTLQIQGGGGFVSSIQFPFENGGSALAEDQTDYRFIPYACLITDWEMGADQAGSVVIDLWVDDEDSFPPTDADSITASAAPALSSEQYNDDATLSGWTPLIPARSWVRATIEGTPDTVTFVNLVIQCNRQ